MSDPIADPADAAQHDLDQVEEQDDETRLKSLEELHVHLEAELERDDPTTEANRRS